MSNPFDRGDTIRLEACFTDINRAAADPTSVTLRIREPDGTVTVLTYADADLTKDGTGKYHYDFAITQDGDHYYRFEGTGGVTTAAETFFRVNRSKILA